MEGLRGKMNMPRRLLACILQMNPLAILKRQPPSNPQPVLETWWSEVNAGLISRGMEPATSGEVSCYYSKGYSSTDAAKEIERERIETTLW